MGTELLSSFSSEDAKKAEQCIDALLPHLAPSEYAFVGGVAIRYIIASAGIEYPARPFNDLDIVVKGPSALRPSIVSTFRIAHYHPKDGYWALVEPTSGVKVDVFSWREPPTIITAPYRDGGLSLQSAEDQLAKTVKDVRKVLRGEAVAPKQFQDAALLLQVADGAIAYAKLQGIASATLPPSITEALDEAQHAAAAHPELLVAKPFQRPKSVECKECVATAEYPLTPLKEIYSLLQNEK